jgi:hypothetical protein
MIFSSMIGYLMVTLRPVIEEAQRIAQLTQLNISIDEYDPPLDQVLIAIHKMVLAEIVANYTLIDEELCAIIQKYFLGVRDRSAQLRLFRQFILNELFLIKKIEIVHAIKGIPKSVRNTIFDINYICNAFAHSLHPASRRASKKHMKVFYRGRDIRTYEGLKIFMEDAHRAHMYLWRRSFHMSRSTTVGKRKRTSRAGL